jgi:hypothetical protein
MVGTPAEAEHIVFPHEGARNLRPCPLRKATWQGDVARWHA